MGQTAPTRANSPKKRRRIWPRLLLAAATLALMALCAELLIRAVDGYRMFAPRLTPVDNRGGSGVDVASDLTDAFLRRPEFADSSLDPAWFSVSPPPVPPQPLPAEMAAVHEQGMAILFNYQWNWNLLRTIWQVENEQNLPKMLHNPGALWVFEPSEPGSLFPRYRLPQSVSLPSGVTFNSLGFRGREIAVDKPAGVVRIACVGASTTLDDHQVAHSYPELLEGLLVRWARERDLGVTFEVINAGCEAYTSSDIAATVDNYVLPLEVDYVVYYEGANQLSPQSMMKHVRVDGEIPPAPSIGGFLDARAATLGEWQWLYNHLATARRLHTVMMGRRPLPEPAKPPQRVELPAGLDDRVDLTRAREVLDLGPIVADLDRIAASTRAANVQLVMTSFRWFVHDGLEIDPASGEYLWRQLNTAHWPISYASMRRIADIQNRWFEAWAEARGVPFLDVAACMPDDARLHTDAVHKTAIGSRCHAYSLASLLVPLLRRDLAAGRIPSPDRTPQPRHPNIVPMRRMTYSEIDAEVGR